MIESAPGKIVAGHRLGELLGAGGHGSVFWAEDPAGRPVALKVLSPGPEANALLRVAERLADIRDPHLVSILGGGRTGEEVWVALELVDSFDLDFLIARSGHLDVAEAVALTEQIAAALDTVHAHGVAHGDVKPANVLLEGELDALSARLTDVGGSGWTADYAAPERVRGGDADRATDVYALGCLLFELLTGAPPFASADGPAKLVAQLDRRPPRPGAVVRGIPPALDRVVLAALSKVPDGRPRTASELARRARTALSDLGAREGRRGRLVGRAADLAAVSQAVRSAPGSLLTLVGPAGVGKTRLAHEVARRLAADFDDVVEVSLGATGDSALIASAIAAGLGVQPGVDPEATLAGRLRDRRALIVLDELEHLPEAAAAVERLVEALAGVHLVATSRVPLGLAGERTHVVARLDEAITTAWFTELAGRPPTADEAAALEGLPLAVEIAAAHAGDGQGLRGRRGVAAVLDRSYRLLDADARRLLARLAVFPGAFSPAAARVVSNGGDGVRAALRALVRAALVRPAADGRLMLFTAVREYALVRLQERGEETPVRRRHAEHVAASVHSTPFPVDGPAMERLAGLADDLRAALRWAEAQREERLLSALALGPGQWWFASGHLAEGRTWLERARPRGPGRQARRLMHLTLLQWGQQDLSALEATGARLLAMDAEGLGVERAEALSLLGLAAMHRGDYAESRRRLQAMMDESAPDRLRRGDRLSNLALVALLEGALDESIDHATAALAAVVERVGRGYTLLTLGEARRRRGDTDTARTAAAEAYAEFAGLDHAEGLLYATLALAAVEADRGQRSSAALLFAAFAAGRDQHGINAVAEQVVVHLEAVLGVAQHDLRDAGRLLAPDRVAALVAGMAQPA